ncbi:hypothetical protein [Thermogutta sp.]|uniref:hypothetical protein n=1 Tax=Thermogutta sp. TaxID=1962930 RepID=UPI0032205CD6
MSQETARAAPPDTVVPEAAAYRPLSAAAVLACVLGVLSVSAFFGPALWVIALAGVIVSLWAWIRIHQFDPPLTGRTGALIGLGLSVFCLVGGPAQWMLQRYLLTQEAQKFAMLFFDYLLHDQPHKAHQLSRAAFDRAPLDEHLWEKYPPDSSARKDLEAFLERKEVRAIILLGKDPRTKIRFFDTEGVWREDTLIKVAQSYAVTYFDTNNVKRTFFLTVILNRYPLRTAMISDWFVSDLSSYTPPHALEDRQKAWEKAQWEKEKMRAFDQMPSPEE